MDMNKYLLGGAAFGAVAGLWAQIKAVIWRFFNVAVKEVEIRDPVVAAALVAYLIGHYRRLGLESRTYSAAADHHLRDGKRRFGTIPYERYGGQSMLFLRGKVPLYYQAVGTPVVNPEAMGTGTQKMASATGSTVAKLLCLRGTMDIDRLISEAVNEWNQTGWELADNGQGARRRFFIKYVPDLSRGKNGDAGGGQSSSWQHFKNIRLLDVDPHDVGIGGSKGGMLERLFFPNEIRALIEEVKMWRKSQEWYAARGIPWKRGWLLYGKPGTGKTALASAFAHDLDLPIFVFNLADMGNLDFMTEWKNMLASVPCIALIEDMDAVFHGRENISRRRRDSEGAGNGGRQGGDEDRGGLSFDVLLNCIDGVDRCEGVFTIITTNHVEHIDPALGQPSRRADGSHHFISTRPGRIDRAVELCELKGYVKKQMARHILGEFPRACEEMLREIDAHPEEVETPAQFQQRCNQLALSCYWNLEQGPAPGESRPLALVADGARA